MFYVCMYLFIERRKGGRKRGEKYQCLVGSHTPPTGDLTHNPGMYPDWESNQWVFGSKRTLNPLSHTSQGIEMVIVLIIP